MFSRRLAGISLSLLVAASQPLPVLNRLLLATTGGSGAFPQGLHGTDLTSTPEGGWVWFVDPRAIASGGYTYVGYNAGGDAKIDVSLAGVHQATRTVHAALEYDDHDVPSLYVRADGKLATWYSKHGGANIYQRISASTLASDPDLSDGFAAETSLSAGFSSAVATYPSPVYQSNQDGSGPALTLFWRETVSGVQYCWYAQSSDDGATWSSAVHIANITYTKVVANGAGRMDLASSEHPADGATIIRHMYRESAAWHGSDGTTITGSIPWASSKLTTVYTASGSDLVWLWDIATDGSDNPIITFVRYPSASRTDHRYMYARWTGSAWDVHEVIAGGGYIVTDLTDDPNQDFYSGGITLDQADPSYVYASIGVGGGVWEWRRGHTTDGGATWSWVTLRSGTKVLRPVAVRNPADVVAVALDGTYTDYLDYSQNIVGFAP